MNGYRRGRSELKVGAYAVLALVVFGLLFGGLTSRGLIRSTTDLFIRLPAADGLLKGDAVLFRGVPVGEVRGIDFGPRGGVLVRAKMRRSVPLTRAASATLAPVDMFGRQAIVLRAGDDPAADLVDGDTLAGDRPASLTGRVERLGSQAERFLGDSTLTLLHDALANVGGAGAGLSVAGQQAAELMAARSRDVEQVIAATDTLLRNLSTATDPAQVERLRGDLQYAASNLGRATARLDSASVMAIRVLGRLERGEGSLGRALNDPALYDRAIVAVAELERLLSDVRSNPGRYVTVRLF